MAALHGLPMTMRTSARFLFFALTAAGPALAESADPPPPTVSRQTTYFLGPIDAEGYVDYRSALETAFGDEKTLPGNNAFLGIHNQLDTEGWNSDYLEALRLQLEVQAHPKTAVVLRTFSDFAEARGEDPENAFEMFDKAIDDSFDPQQGPLISEWLDEMATPLEAISTAIRRPHYFAPLIPDSEKHGLGNIVLPHLGSHRLIARAMALRIDRSLLENDLGPAINDLLTIHRLARLQTHESSLISSLVGISIHGIAYKRMKAVLNHPDLKKQHVIMIQDGFGSLPQSCSIARVLGEGERGVVLDVTQQLARGRMNFLAEVKRMQTVAEEPQPPQGEAVFSQLIRDPRFDQDVMLRRINTFWDEYLSPDLDPLAYLKDEDRLYDALQAIEPSQATINELIGWGRAGLPAEADAHAASELVAEFILCIMLPALDPGVSLWLQDNTTHQLETVALALALYRLNEGTFPAALTDLVPRYLGDVPDDPYSDGPLIYRPEGAGYLLYSVHADREDDGGLDEPNRDADMVIRVGATVAQ